MSSIQSRTLSITYDNCTTYFSSVGDAKIHGSPLGHNNILYLTYASYSTSGDGVLTSAAMDVLYPNTTAHPTSCYFYYKQNCVWTSNASTAFIFNGTTLGSATTDTDGEIVTATTSDSAVMSSTKSSTILFRLSRTKKYLSYIGVSADGADCIITLYFVRYDFTAVAGANVSSAAVSSSTGYDGDTITYSCTTNGGAFLGWYNGDTLVSTDQTYTHTVNGADLTLTAKASTPTTKTLSASYNGAQLSGFPLSVSGDAAISYGGSAIATVPFSGGTKTLKCAGKVMSGNVSIGDKTLQCSGKLMASDVVFAVS